ncbi:polymorphic toxin-type HINT domain-containing protein [Actinoplanes sp. NPDC049681]|uniref:polymorphic toxin-type HINT domain-containing protein n=1 Tax=Actinoplanes sp. NPDC049681 TaxID=3363905 RepID=UPI0037907CD4
MTLARIGAAIAGLLVVTLLPQSANAAVPVAPKAAASTTMTPQQWIERERATEAAQERSLLAEGPIDDAELNRMLIQDLADYDEDTEVRAAAATVLQTNDAAEFTAFLDRALPVYRAAADERRKRIAAANRSIVQNWAETGGPIVRQRAAAALATKDDKKIADFVAIGHEAAVAADNQDEINAAEQAKTIKARVEQIIASGGYEVKSAGQAALDTEDPATIAAFYKTGYAAAAARDSAAQQQIEAALKARTKAVTDLTDLATRATQAANARTTIITESVTATQSLTVAANSMGLVNKYAKQADAIYTSDLPIRKAGGKTHTADLTKLRSQACAEAATTSRNAGQVAAHTGVAQSAAATLVKTGLTHGVDWAEVMGAQSDAAAAATLAAETACHAAEATEAAGKALDADHNATVSANNAVKYRQAAEREAAAATKLADQAEKLAAAAQAAEADAHKQRLRAEQDAKDAGAHADDAHDHYVQAKAQRDTARRQTAIAIAQQAAAYDAARRAVAQQNIAGSKGATAKAAADEVTAGIKRFDGLVTDSKNASLRAQQAMNERNAKEVSYAAYQQDAIAKKGTAEGDRAAQQAAIIEAQLPAARAAADKAQAAANSAADAADAAATASQRAGAAAAAARAEAEAAAAAAAAARRDAADAAAAAGQAIADAQRANESARQSVNVARQAINRAVAAKADAELTGSAADSALREAGIASFQSRVAGRAAINARAAATAIADPAASALTVAEEYADTDNDAAMTVDVANNAILIGAEQGAAAERHAADAQAAAVHAAEQALRAQQQVKPAYAAAQKAAEEAARALRASKVAIAAARGAVAEAKATVEAATDASDAAQQAAGYSNAAERMAVDAGHDAAIARQAAGAARGYSNQAKTAADNASKIAKQIAAASISANNFANAMKASAAAMAKIAKDTHAAVKQVADVAAAEKRARQTAWMKEWNDEHKAEIEASDYPDWYKKFVEGETETITGIVGGLWMTGLCVFGKPGNNPGDTPDSEEACDMLKEGMTQLVENPGSLIHLDEWRNGEYAKALGMTVIDLLTLDIPKIGKIAAGVDVLKEGLVSGLSKLISGELLAGIKKLGTDTMEAALNKLGALKVAKLLELDVDLPKKLTFSPAELSALKLSIDINGFPAVESALRGLADGKTILEGLENLLKRCSADSFAPETRVLLADGTTEPIADIEVGEEVLATDPETGATSAEPVTELHRNLDTDFADVTVGASGGDQVVRTTQHHPFWSATTRSWIDAGDLGSGETLLGRGGPATVKAVDKYTGSRIMHNLTVASVHTFYVVAGADAILVHNCTPTLPRHADTCECDNGRGPITGVSPKAGDLVVLGVKEVGDPLADELGGMTFNGNVYGFYHDTALPQWVREVKNAIRNPEIELAVDLGRLETEKGMKPIDIYRAAAERGKVGWVNGRGTDWEMRQIEMAAESDEGLAGRIRWFYYGEDVTAKMAGLSLALPGVR